jgi:aspartate racemase
MNATTVDGVVGVLGGMGPLATVDFMHKMLSATPARTDQDHVPVVVSSIPQVPDRSAAFRGAGASPLDALVASGRRLVGAGAELVVMPCNTAHLWFDELQRALGVPMLHLVDAAIEEATRVHDLPTIGLLATEATLASGLYPRRAGASLQWALPRPGEVRELVMPGIAAVKAGRLDEGRSLLAAAAANLQRRGATMLILGCSEIPLVLHGGNAPLPVVDATDALARRAVSWSLARRRAAA